MTEQIQTLECRLGCISRRSKSTLNSIKSDFNAFRRKPSLGACWDPHFNEGNKRDVTLSGRDFSSAASGFCQVFIVTRGLWPKMCQPLANTENSRRTREKPLVPRVWVSRNPQRTSKFGWPVVSGGYSILFRRYSSLDYFDKINIWDI